VKALDRKLARDLWSLKTQVLSIALVIACGIGGFIGSLSTYASLTWSRDNYYDVARFPDLFASAVRAPVSLLERVRAKMGTLGRDYVVRIDAAGAPDEVESRIERVLAQRVGSALR